MNIVEKYLAPIFHADYIGSSNILTEGEAKATHGGFRFVKGELVQRIEYTPFGKERLVLNSSLEELPKYTGQTQDIEVDLYYYGSRYYDPVIGRFIQPDSIIPDAYSSQSLNPYAYVLNNPLRYTDPTGHFVDPVDDPTTSADNLTGDDPVENAYSGDNEEGTATSPEGNPASENNAGDSGHNPVDENESRYGELITPSDVDIDENIEETEQGSLIGWVNRVREYGEWDYKLNRGREYENFGNYNYGATGAAEGFELETLQRFAGVVSEYAGTYDPRYGHWYSGPPYGDDEKDQYWIERGYDYYHGKYDE